MSKAVTYKFVRSTINAAVNERTVGGSRGWLAGNAADYYNKGVTESMKFYNIAQSEIDKFLTANPYPGNTEKGLHKIREQKYMAFFESSGRQAFYIYRRTGVPASNIGQSNANNNQIPVPWAYPTSEYTTNEVNVKALLKPQFNGADTQNGLMWLIK